LIDPRIAYPQVHNRQASRDRGVKQEPGKYRRVEEAIGDAPKTLAAPVSVQSRTVLAAPVSLPEPCQFRGGSTAGPKPASG
jgi:hypothetical protein